MFVQSGKTTSKALEMLQQVYQDNPKMCIYVFEKRRCFKEEGEEEKDDCGGRDLQQAGGLGSWLLLVNCSNDYKLVVHGKRLSLEDFQGRFGRAESLRTSSVKTAEWRSYGARHAGVSGH